MKDSLKIFMFTILSLIVIFSMTLGISYAINPSLVRYWFGISEEQSIDTEEPDEETPGTDTEDPGTDTEDPDIEEPGIEEPGEEIPEEDEVPEPEIKILDFTFSDGALTGYTGSETEIVIPSSYSIATKEYGLFNDADELSEFWNSSELSYPAKIIDSRMWEYNFSSDMDVPDMSYSFPVKVEIEKYVQGDDYMVTSIGSSSFMSCQIVSVVIPEGVQSIGSYAFNGSDNLSHVELPNSLIEIEEGAFSSCSSLTEIELPNKLKEIGTNAFNGSCIEYIVIPASVTIIGNWSLDMAYSLKAIIFEGQIPPQIDEGFASIWEYKIYVPEGAVDTYKTAEGWSQYADIIFANTELSIGDTEIPEDDDIVEIG